MMSRKLVSVVGLGPGNAQFLTAQAQAALQNADVLCGYTVYIDLVRPHYPEKEVYTTRCWSWRARTPTSRSRSCPA